MNTASSFWTDKELSKAYFVSYTVDGVTRTTPMIFPTKEAAERYRDSWIEDGISASLVPATRDLIDSL